MNNTFLGCGFSTESELGTLPEEVMIRKGVWTCPFILQVIFFLLRLQHGNLKRHGRLVMFNTLWLTGLQGFAYLCWICLKVQLIRYENCIDWFLDHVKTVLQRSSVSLRSTYLLIFTHIYIYIIYIYISTIGSGIFGRFLWHSQIIAQE